jgi:hypothetical protein
VIAALLATPGPTPTPVEMEPWTVSPGLEGFFWGFFVLALVSIPLFWSMTRHMRKVDHNARMRDLAERAEREGTDGAVTPEGAGPVDGARTPQEAGPTDGATPPAGGSSVEDASASTGAERADGAPTPTGAERTDGAARPTG